MRKGTQHSYRSLQMRIRLFSVCILLIFHIPSVSYTVHITLNIENEPTLCLTPRTSGKQSQCSCIEPVSVGNQRLKLLFMLHLLCESNITHLMHINYSRMSSLGVHRIRNFAIRLAMSVIHLDLSSTW